MSDGVGLATDVHEPDTGADRDAVTFLLRTPYGRNGSFDAVPETARYFTNLGHILVAQDVRGKFDSEGACDPFSQERKDGADTVSWLAEQKWCTNKIVPIGESYCGFTALMSASSGHTSVAAVMAGMTTSKIASDWLKCDDVFRLHLNADWITMAFGFNGLPNTQPWSIDGWWSVEDIEQVDTGSANLRTLRALREAGTSQNGDALLAGGLNERAAQRANAPLILWSGYWDPLVRGTIAEYRAAIAARPNQAHHLELLSADHLGNKWEAALNKANEQSDRASSLVRCYERNMPHLYAAIEPGQLARAPRVEYENQLGETFQARTWPPRKIGKSLVRFNENVTIPSPRSFPDLPDSGETFVWGSLAANYPSENSVIARNDVVAYPFYADELTGELVLEGKVHWDNGTRVIATVAQEQADGRMLRVVEGVASRDSNSEEHFQLALGPACHEGIAHYELEAQRPARWWLILMQEHYPRYLPRAQSHAWLAQHANQGHKSIQNTEVTLLNLSLRVT